MVYALERQFIRDAAVVSTVSGGIADRLDNLYRLCRSSVVVRNTPPFEAMTFRPTAERIRVLYHGIITPGRGLEATIDSVTAWRSAFDLTLRGPGKSSYLRELRRRIIELGLEEGSASRHQCQ